MVFTVNQTRSFFTEPDQMAVDALTLPGLAQEGISRIDDLEDFTEEDIKQVANNLRKPAGTMANPNAAEPPTALAPARIPQVPYVFGAKSMKRMKIATIAVSYYTAIDRESTPNNMHYQRTLIDFHEQWENLVKKGEESAPTTPCVTRSLPIIKWTESFTEFLHQVLGVSHVPLSYVIREHTLVTAPPALLTNRSYSEEHGSVEGELIARSSHNTAHYKADNATVFKYIEEATRETRYSSSISPFSRKKDGRGAWMALVAQYVGKDKWQNELERQETFLHTRIWKGNSNFPLESFIMQHRSAHVSMTRCADHVPYQLPNERTRVMHLLNGIKSSDAELLSALAVIKSDDGPGGRIERFEDTAAYLIRFDPVSSKRQRSGASGRQQHQVSGVELKNGIGKTGVALRYHSKQEYRNLSDEQKRELKIFREGTRDKRKGDERGPNVKGPKRQKSFHKQLVSALKELAEPMEMEKKQEPSEDEVRSMLVSALHEVMSVDQQPKVNLPPPPATKQPLKPPSRLNTIINRLRQPK